MKDKDRPIFPRFKIHYASGGEWGGSRVNCGRYDTTDVSHTEKQNEITCKRCLKLFKKE